MDLLGLPQSDQTGPHERLAEWVKRHQTTVSKRPVADHSRRSFEQAQAWLSGFEKPSLILDACCGRGDSAFWAAQAFPQALVIAVDKSEKRLGALTREHPRILCLRADLRDFYRLAEGAGWRLFRHHMLYPNPYPKASQLGRRWHAMSVFPTMLKLGGVLILRTNFEIYADEWQQALALSGYKSTRSSVRGKAATLFEEKYMQRGHPLVEVSADVT